MSIQELIDLLEACPDKNLPVKFKSINYIEQEFTEVQIIEHTRYFKTIPLDSGELFLRLI